MPRGGHDCRGTRQETGVALRQQETRARLALWVRAGLVWSLLAGFCPPHARSEPNRPDGANGPASPAGSDQAGESFWTRDTMTGTWNGMRASLEEAGVKLGLQEQSEVWADVAGGRRRGVAYNGLTTASVSLDLDKLMGWTGAKFFANAYQIHGSGPSVNLVGGLQLVSNIEATRDTKLYQLWIEQTLWNGRLSVRIGQGGVNDEMMTSAYAALYLSASFGLSGLAAANLPSGGPSYPIATPFARVQYKPNDQITLLAGVFNGDPAPSGGGDPQLRDKGGVAFRTNDHLLAAAEIWYAINQEDDAPGLPGTYKIGAWFHSGRFDDQRLDTNGVSLASSASNGIPASHSPNFAVYGVVDQMLWKKPGTKKQGIGAFVQVTGGPADYNLSQVFVFGGVNWFGPIAGREDDVLGIGVAYLGISPAKRRFGNDLIFFTGQGVPYSSNETVIEVTGQFQVTPWWTLQPDLQIVVNPGAGIPTNAGTKPLKQAIITGLRATITF
jgi:porin